MASIKGMNVTNGQYTILTAVASTASGVSGSGTANSIPKFSGTTSLGDSQITDTGSLVTIGGNYVNIGTTGATVSTAGDFIQLAKGMSFTNATNAATYSILRSNTTIAVSGASSVSYRALKLDYTIANTGTQTGNMTGLVINGTEVSLSGMTHTLLDLQNGGTSKFKVSGAGLVTLAGGTPLGMDFQAPVNMNFATTTANTLACAFSVNGLGSSGGLYLINGGQGIAMHANITSGMYLNPRANSATTPSYSFFGDTNTGMYSSTGDTINFTAGGTDRLVLVGTGTTLSAGTTTIATISSAIAQTSTAGYTGLKVNISEAGGTGTGSKLLVDAQNTSVSKFSVDSSGNVTNAGTHIISVVAKTTNYNVAKEDAMVTVGASGLTITLPAATTVGEVHIIKNLNFGTTTIATLSGAATIDGAATYSLGAAYGSVQLVCTASNQWSLC